MHDNQAAVDHLGDLGVIWRHGEGSRVHAVLTSGKHSDFFCNISRLLENPSQMSAVCGTLLESLGNNLPLTRPVRFIGQAMGSISIASELARQSGNRFAFTEKDGDRMILNRFSLDPEELVIVVEDVFTTGGTTLKTIYACEEAGAEVFPVVLAIVNRSGKEYFSGRGPDLFRLYPYAKISGTEWLASECPLCSGRSVPKKPKANWSEFCTA